MRGEWEIFVQDSSRVTPAACAETRTQAPHARRWFWCTLKVHLISNSFHEPTHPPDFKHNSWRLGAQKWVVDRRRLQQRCLTLRYTISTNLLPSCGWFGVTGRAKTFSKQHKTLMTFITFSEIEPPNARHLLTLQHKTKWRHAASSLWTIYICNISCLLRENTMIRLIWKNSWAFVQYRLYRRACCSLSCLPLQRCGPVRFRRLTVKIWPSLYIYRVWNNFPHCASVNNPVWQIWTNPKFYKVSDS